MKTWDCQQNNMVYNPMWDEVSEEEAMKRVYLKGIFDSIKAKGFDTLQTRIIIEKTNIIDSIWNEMQSMVKIPFETLAERVLEDSRKNSPKRRLSHDEQLNSIAHLMENRLKMLHSLGEEDQKVLAEDVIRASGLDGIMKATGSKLKEEKKYNNGTVFY